MIARLIPMKRELKVVFSYCVDAFPHINRKAHPDEKGTERVLKPSPFVFTITYRKAHPDEKGTESLLFVRIRYGQLRIARLIPMKRELKEATPGHNEKKISYRKAHPDEKGTESDFANLKSTENLYRKAHPDEKGTESASIICNIPSCTFNIASAVLDK